MHDHPGQVAGVGAGRSTTVRKWEALSLREPSEQRASGRLQLDPAKVERGLAQLVLTLIELLRQLMERQAVHRFESGTLSPEQEEALGIALSRLSERMDELKDHFELSDEDLNINLGPLGDLL